MGVRECVLATSMSLTLLPWSAEARDGEPFAMQTFDQWQAEAVKHENYYSCEMKTSEARLVQSRLTERAEMPSRWRLMEADQRRLTNFRMDRIKIGQSTFQFTRLPWRLAGNPVSNGIVVSFEAPLLAIRRDEKAEWLPLEYANLLMLDADQLEVEYSYDDDAERRIKGRKKISLKGFREAAKWCGRQLLVDRLNEAHVEALTR
jgi:hypothetical protein